MNSNKKKTSFDEAFVKLRESAEAISNPNITLEDAIKNYKTGKEYYETCRELLEEAKQLIEVYDREKNEVKTFEEG